MTTTEPKLGSEIVPDHLLFHFTPMPPYQDERAAGLGVFVCTEPTVHVYVVWTLYLARQPGPWRVERGDYCATLDDALVAYQDRGGITEADTRPSADVTMYTEAGQ